MSEIISIHIGLSGIQLGDMCWKQYCMEHQIEPDDPYLELYNIENKKINFHFLQDHKGKVSTRSLFIDYEQNILNLIHNNPIKAFYNKKYHFIKLKQPEDGTFIQGQEIIDKEVQEEIISKIKLLEDNCHELDGFIIYQHVGEGYGSGIGSKILEILYNEYYSKYRFNIILFPGEQDSNSSFFSPYNSTLALQNITDYSTTTICLEQSKLYEISKNFLCGLEPTMKQMNQLSAQVISQITATLRFSNTVVNTSLMEFQRNLIPYPRLGFLIPSITGLYSKLIDSKSSIKPLPLADLAEQCYLNQNYLVDCDIQHGLYMGSCTLCRGNWEEKDIGTMAHHLKASEFLEFANWCPDQISFQRIVRPPMDFDDSCFRSSDRINCSLSNSTAISELFERQQKQVMKMYKKKAYLQYFRCDFENEIDNLKSLIDDYAEVEAYEDYDDEEEV